MEEPLLLDKPGPQAENIPMGKTMGCIISRNTDIISFNFSDKNHSKRSDSTLTFLKVGEQPDRFA